MKFVIDRTSRSSLSNEKPCEEAVECMYDRTDERIVGSPFEMRNADGGNHWYERGFNHRVDDGHIKRDIKETGYEIEINSLDELKDFISKYGSIIIEKEDNYMYLEIYDGYRE